MATTTRRNRQKVEDKRDFSDLKSRIKPVESKPLKVSLSIYGRSGTGKTTFASTMPTPILLLDAKEEGTDSISNVAGVDVLDVESFDDVEMAYWFLKTKEGRKYNSVVIDTLTQIQDIVLAEVCEANRREIPTKREWGQLAQQLKPWILRFRDLPQHSLFICQDRVTESETEDEDQIMPEVGPRLSPSIASALNAAVKIIAQTYIKEVTKTKGDKITSTMQYRLRVGPHPYYLTKVRSPRESYTPDSLINPTFDDVVKIMKGEYEPPVRKEKKA